MMSEAVPPHAPPRPTLLTLPRDVLLLILKEVTHTNDLVSLSLTNSTLYSLSIPYIYGRFDIVWPDTTNQNSESKGVDALVYGLATLCHGSKFGRRVQSALGKQVNTPEKKALQLQSANYAHYTRKFSLGNGPESWVSEYLITKETGKMLGTMVAIAVEKMINLETFVWDMPTGVLSDIFMSLSSLADRPGHTPRLERVWVRWHDNSDVSVLAAPPPPGLIPGSVQIPPGMPTGTTLTPIGVLIPSDSRHPEPSKPIPYADSKVEYPTFSVLSPLKSLTVLDIDEVAYLDEMAMLIERSQHVLQELRVGISSKACTKDFAQAWDGPDLLQTDLDAKWPGESTIRERRLGGVLGILVGRIYEIRRKTAPKTRNKPMSDTVPQPAPETTNSATLSAALDTTNSATPSAVLDTTISATPQTTPETTTNTTAPADGTAGEVVPEGFLADSSTEVPDALQADSGVHFEDQGNNQGESDHSQYTTTSASSQEVPVLKENGIISLASSEGTHEGSNAAINGSSTESVTGAFNVSSNEASHGSSNDGTSGASIGDMDGDTGWDANVGAPVADEAVQNANVVALKPPETAAADATKETSSPSPPGKKRLDGKLRLSALELERVSLSLHVCARALDWTLLTSLVILDCAQHEGLWRMLRRQFRPTAGSSSLGMSHARPSTLEYHLNIKRIHTDLTTLSLIAFLKETLAPNSLEVMFLQDRRRGNQPPSVEMNQIYKGPIRRHRTSLRKMLIDSSANASNAMSAADSTRWREWVLKTEVVDFITSGRMPNLRELSASLEYRDWHMFLQRLPNASQLRSIHIPHVADHVNQAPDSKDLAHQILDIVHLRPEIQLCYAGILTKCFEFLEVRGNKTAGNQPAAGAGGIGGYNFGDDGGAGGDGGVFFGANADDDDDEGLTDEEDEENMIPDEDYDEEDDEDEDDMFASHADPANDTMENAEDSDDSSLGDLPPVRAKFRLREILFYDDKVDIFQARHARL